MVAAPKDKVSAPNACTELVAVDVRLIVVVLPMVIAGGVAQTPVVEIIKLPPLRIIDAFTFVAPPRVNVPVPFLVNVPPPLRLRLPVTVVLPEPLKVALTLPDVTLARLASVSRVVTVGE